jgi:hypothetical protein
VSIYERMNYDRLLERVGITPGEVWHCGANQAPDVVYDDSGTYDGSGTYTGWGQLDGGGLCLTGDINVNGLLLNHRDDNGTIWLCTGVEGWWTLPPSEMPDVPQPYWDGSLLTTGRYLSRTITITGAFIPQDKSMVWYNRNVLMQVGSIVRGSGLIAMCGNESPENPHWFDGNENDDDYLNPFYDPPKMAIIQTADVPLVDTTKPSGFTVFSLSFRCVQPTKLSLYERTLPLVVPDGGYQITRRYAAFSTTTAQGDTATTEYAELTQMPGYDTSRVYSGVLTANLNSLIPDEELTDPVNPDMSDYVIVGGSGGGAVPHTTVHNAGNYFSFPIFVFGPITNADPSHKPTPSVVTLTNTTTGEQMTVVGNVPDDRVLVVDTGLRRVALANETSSPDSWDWNQRGKLSLGSQWVSLAPGDNTILAAQTGAVTMPQQPEIYWRDVWIG